MPQLPQPVDTNQVQDMNQRKLVPPGTYLANITSSEFKENSKGTGHYLLMTIKILQGPEAGSELTARLNLYHSTSTTAVEIAQRELATMWRACGLGGVADNSDRMHGIPMEIDVIEEPSNDPKYGPNSKISMYRAASGAVAAPPVAPAAPQVTPGAVQAPVAPQAPQVAAPVAQVAPQAPVAPAPAVAPAPGPALAPAAPQPAPGAAPW